MTTKIDIDSEAQVLVEPDIVDKLEPKVIEDQEPEPEVKNLKVKEPLIETLVNLPA